LLDKLLSLTSKARRKDELRKAYGSDPVKLFPCKYICLVRRQKRGAEPPITQEALEKAPWTVSRTNPLW